MRPGALILLASDQVIKIKSIQKNAVPGEHAERNDAGPDDAAVDSVGPDASALDRDDDARLIRVLDAAVFDAHRITASISLTASTNIVKTKTATRK